MKNPPSCPTSDPEGVGGREKRQMPRADVRDDDDDGNREEGGMRIFTFKEAAKAGSYP